MWQELHEEFLLNGAASRLLGKALVHLDRADRCDRQVAKEGELIAGRYASSPRAHPLAAMSRDAVRTAERLFARLELQLGEDTAERPGARRGGRPGASRSGVPPRPRLLRADLEEGS